MNAKARAARQTVKIRSAQTRLTASLHRGRSLATHLLAAGIDTETAKGVANGLRSVAKRLRVAPVKTARTHRTVAGPEQRTRRVGHYTATQVHTLLVAYKPRRADYRDARNFMLAN